MGFDHNPTSDKLLREYIFYSFRSRGGGVPAQSHDGQVSSVESASGRKVEK
jgi:hypothetical protein